MKFKKIDEFKSDMKLLLKRFGRFKMTISMLSS